MSRYTEKERENFVIDVSSFAPRAHLTQYARLFQVIRGGTKVDSMTGAAEDKLQKMVAEHCKKSN